MIHATPFLFILIAFSPLVQSSHFRGAIISWKPSTQQDEILVTYRISWRRSHGTNAQCNKTSIASRRMLPGEGNLVYNSATKQDHMKAEYQCVDFSAPDDWITGERSNYVMKNVTDKVFRIGFTGCCWIDGLYKGGGGDWRIWTKVDLNRRPDNGRINSSPISSTQPIVDVQFGCVHVIHIPVSDPDNDMVKCRFAKGGQECGAICDGLPGATIDEDKCTLTYNANQQKGLFPISIQIEDYASKTSTIPLSSVALQFLINVYQSSGKCSDKPYFSSTSPLDASCENIPVNGTYITRIVVTSGSPNDHITEFTTSSPSGMIKSDVQKVINATGLPTLAKGVTWYYINVTWTARQNQKGANIFCFTAVAQSKRNSERRCITLYVGASTPKIDKLSLQPKPNEIVRSTTKIFQFRYDQDIIKATSNALIKILRDDGEVTYNFTIDSNNIKILQNRIIQIHTPGLKFEEARRYAIVADAGFVKGKHECGKEADAVTSNFGWSFVVSDNFPRLLNSPAVNVNVVNGKMHFQCGFQASNGNLRAVYEVEWFNGNSDNPIKKDIITDNNTSNLVYHTQFCLGTELHCKVRSWFSNSSNIKSNLHESEKFFIGVKSDPEVITLVEGQDPAQVTLSPTIPIICVNNTDSCEVEVAIAQQNSEVMLSRCSVKFGPKHPTRQTITIYPKEDFIIDGRKSLTLRRILHGTRGVSNWLCYEDTRAIQLTVDDRPTLQCSSTGDPHIYTFDNDRRYFDLHYPGDFVMVQSVKNNFKVHARTFMCRKSIACNCGIAAQENDDVVSIDVCKGGPKFRFPMSQNQHSGTKLNKISNSQYEINFPSGASVKVHLGSYVNVYIKIPATYYNATQGLCGIPDSDVSNELSGKDGKVYQAKRYPNAAFLTSWKLTSEESLFFKKSGKKSCRKPASAKAEEKYCICNYGGEVEKCTTEGYAVRPTFGGAKPQTIVSNAFANCEKSSNKEKAAPQIVIPDVDDKEIYRYNPPVDPVVVPTWPTKSGRTEADAKKICADAISKSSSGKACKKTLGDDFDVDTFKTECVADIQLTDSLDFIKSSLNSMTTSCEEKALKDIKYWNNATGTNGTLTPPVAIGNNLCPNDCNNQGQCVNSTCVCNQGFESVDCSLVQGKPPSVDEKFIACDNREDNCLSAGVFGDGFSDSSNLTCRFYKIQVTGQPPYRKVGNPILTNGTSVSFSEMACTVPSLASTYSNTEPALVNIGGYEIGVSNDGINYSSNTSTFVYYDSKCMTCNDTTEQCEKKTDTCLIDNVCYRLGEAKPGDNSAYCNPTKDSKKFVAKPRYECKIGAGLQDSSSKINLGTSYASFDSCKFACIAKMSSVPKINGVHFGVLSPPANKPNNPPSCHCLVGMKKRKLRNSGQSCLLKDLEEWHSYVTCADNEMILHVNRMRYPVNQKQVITLKDNRCSGVFNSSHTIIKTSFDQCGTTVEERNNYIIYKNTAKLVVGNDTVAGNGVITRKRIVNIKMECKHEKMINVSTTGAFKPVNASITTTESGMGTFQISISLLKTRSYLSKYKPEDYPVSIELSDRIYLGMELDASHSDLALTLQNCYATSTPNALDTLRYNFVVNRCPKDDTFQMHKQSKKMFQYSIQAFQFLRQTSGIYIHCGAVVCKASSPDGRCQFGCGQKRKRREADEDEKTGISKYYVVSSGYVKLEGGKETKNEESKSFFSGAKGGTIAGVIGIACIGMIVVVAIKIRQQRRRPVNTKKTETEFGMNTYTNDGFSKTE